ncbi:MAG: rRNA pseudouridine synthase [Candidatus Krumholzibacteriota bacterium]|nr:rRNA pseudouridine synthase [Candidatus Krumholzibacteriota bacterium]
MIDKIRINRFLASSGLGSRRKVEDLITRGSVFVNGVKVEDFSITVEPGHDKVTVDGDEISLPSNPHILVLNKPVGVLCTVTDGFKRKTVIDIARDNGYRDRIYPVGRLDLNSSGLIILTDNGDLAFRLTHPRYKIDKRYIITVEGKVSEETRAELESGVIIGEFTTKPCRIKLIDADKTKTTLEVILREGRKRQIRRMFARYGHKVLSLHRSAIGDLFFRDLAPGNIRPLTADEEKRLKNQVGL